MSAGSLLIDQGALPEGASAHVGTMDLDVGLKLALFDEGRYRTLTERLRDAGFAQDHTDEGRPTPGAVRCERLLDRTRYDNMSYQEGVMPKTKVAVTVDSGLLDRVDDLVAVHRFANRSQAVESALADTVARLARTRLARECAKLDRREEQALAEEGLAGSRDAWPEY